MGEQLRLNRKLGHVDEWNRGCYSLAQLFKLKLKTILNNKFISKKIKLWTYVMDI